MPTSSWNATPEPAGAGSTRNPSAAGNGLPGAPRCSTASPEVRGTLDVDRGRLAERRVDAEIAGQRGLDDLFLYLSVERDGQLVRSLPDVDQRVLLGELPESDAERSPVTGTAGYHDRFQRRRGELVSLGPDPARRERPDLVADLDLVQAPELADLAGRDRRPGRGRPALEHADRGHLVVLAAVVLAAVVLAAVVLAASGTQPVPGSDRAREHPDIGDLLAGGAALDLEDAARDGSGFVARRGRQELGEASHQRRHARPGDRGAEVDGVHQGPPGLGREFPAQLAVGNGQLIVYVRGQDLVVPFGEHLGQPGPGRGIRRLEGRKGRHPAAEPAGASHRDDGRGEPFGDRPQDPPLIRARTVDLVHEQQGRDAQPLQGSHQDASLRLHALDGGEHQDGAVQDAQHPLDLSDEVRVAGGVDQVDRDGVDGERGDRGLDRDPALPLQRQRIGLRGAGIDAADLVDDTGGVQEPLGESGLTGVYMRQDAQVERALRQASYPSRS